MFENIPAAPADPILGLADLFRADARTNKINLGIGVYKDETGKTPVLTSVKKAEQYLLENEITKNYLSIDGIPAFATWNYCLVKKAQSFRTNVRMQLKLRVVPVLCVWLLILLRIKHQLSEFG